MAIAALQQIQQEAPAEPLSTPAAIVAAHSAELVYFTFGKRCPTCRRMEQWAKDIAMEMGIAFVQKEGYTSAIKEGGDAIIHSSPIVALRGYTKPPLLREKQRRFLYKTFY